MLPLHQGRPANSSLDSWEKKTYLKIVTARWTLQIKQGPGSDTGGKHYSGSDPE